MLTRVISGAHRLLPEVPRSIGVRGGSRDLSTALPVEISLVERRPLSAYVENLSRLGLPGTVVSVNCGR